ncbi:cilia- and flagella-associated protein 70-like isoform X3 [Gigantopelta aegis]|uniref:cilia- and flagella-associated protein 70-like isoform X3 n=1 Tax=Gigantopelta aegis TaxID=1735272 RepID=UPI001B88B127|nr:cilia- and flagella-associated protein 70-like isoform X3 [Gigantopelta aegis]
MINKSMCSSGVVKENKLVYKVKATHFADETADTDKNRYGIGAGIGVRPGSFRVDGFRKSFMADVEAPSVRPPEAITIAIHRVRGLKGQKGDVVNTTIRVEFGEKTIGESPKVDCTLDSSAEFNYNATLNCTYDDPIALDEIANRPVVLTFIEVLPKEKRQKEEKTILLGQCTVDLLPLLKGETTQKYTLVINSLPGSPLEQIPPDFSRPEVDVTISVNDALLDESQLNDGNLFAITMESLYSPPDSWTQTGQQYHFVATLPIPVSGEKEFTLVYPSGQLKPPIDKELPNKQKKWAIPGSAQGPSQYINDSFISTSPIEDEDGDFKEKEDREHRSYAESEKNRVCWNTERRCYLEASAIKNFQDSVAKCRLWPVEIFRIPQASAGKGKKGRHYKEDHDASISFHGVAFVDLAPLLYPGVSKIHGAYKVYAYTDHLLNEKTGGKRKTGLAEEASKVAFNLLNRNSTSPSPKKGAKDEKKDLKKGSGALLANRQSPRSSFGKLKEVTQAQKSDTASEYDQQVPVNTEGQQYVDCKSYIKLEFALTRPLVPKRPPEELARRVAEYIPPRPMFPKRTDGATRAVEDYHNQVATVANLILDEFRELFSDEIKEGENETAGLLESRRHKLIYQLNSSGKYFAFKEQLKHSVVKIVREKYLKTTTFEDRQEFQTFLSELYVYLIDQMHVSLGSVLALEDQPPIPKPLTDSAQLKHFAREAEVNENFALAERYYQERIARDKLDADSWFDYGTYCLYVNDVTKAEECFKECISLDQKHIYGLLLYGVVCTMTEKNELAETFFEAATCVNPKSILAWTMLGLYYDAVSNEIGAEMAYMEANKLNNQAAVSAAKDVREDEVDKEKEEKKDSVAEPPEPLPDADTAQDPELIPSSEGGLSVPGPPPELIIPTPTSAANSAKSSQRNNHEKRPSVLKKPGAPSQMKGKEQGSSIHQSRPTSTQKSQHDTPQPTDENLEDMPLREPTPVPTWSVYMQAVDWLLEVKAVPFTERALAHELLLPTGGPTAAYYIALAHLMLQKREFADAEENLKEALQLEHQNPDGWALKGHVKYLTGDLNTARECYERTLSFITDASEMHSIYLRLASIYLQEARFSEAKSTFLMACKRSPSCVSWLGVGIACYRLGELSEAEDALSEANILNNNDAEVWGYLSLVCLNTGRQLEAEQAYKYALKLNLDSEELIEEIKRKQEEVGFGNPQF